ncbi:hypothetical protein Tco_1518021 [Tanacetum coccineum]
MVACLPRFYGIQSVVGSSIVETDKVIYTGETDMVKLVVEIDSFGMSADELDKETGSSDGLQLKQADLSCVHALNEPHLHEIHVVPSRHEADQFPYIRSEFFPKVPWRLYDCLPMHRPQVVIQFLNVEGPYEWKFSMDSKFILPCCLFIMYS